MAANWLKRTGLFILALVLIIPIGLPSLPVDGIRPLLAGQASGMLVNSLGSGRYHTCAALSDGSVLCWGYNSTGQSTPPGNIFIQVSAGYGHTCGIKSNNTIACWGSNSYGQATPPSGTFTQVSAGWQHTCGLKTNGTVACWGQNNYSQATPPAGTFTKISAGFEHNCGLKTDGTAACWGANLHGQSTAPAGTFTQITAGWEHNCGLKTNGSIACWGHNDYKQSNPPAGTFTGIGAGAWHTCAIKNDSTLTCWGRNDSGQATPPAGTFTQLSGGLDFACGQKTDGAIPCWGSNTYKQLNSPRIIAGNAGAGGTSLSYTDGSLKTATADTNGDYTLTIAYNWSGTVTPSNFGYIFTPSNRAYSKVLLDKTGENYTATLITYTISGNAGIGGATLDYDVNGTPRTATADSSGHYSFTVPYNWSGTVTPSLAGYLFTPPSLSYSTVLADQANQDYTTTASYTISGNAGLAGVTLKYTYGVERMVTSGADGNYRLPFPTGWSGSVVPFKEGFAFTPPQRDYVNIPADQPGQDYTATAITYTISGNAGVAAAILGYTDGSPKTIPADENGDYSFTVSHKWSGTVTPSLTGYTFIPPSRSYSNVLSHQPGQDYTASRAATATFYSTGRYDGWVLESSQFGNKGKVINRAARTFWLGDDAFNRQYRAILSFDTATLPVNATIASAVLRIRQSGKPTGNGNPLDLLGRLLVDIRKGTFGKIDLEAGDFQAKPSSRRVGIFGKTPSNSWYSATLNSIGRSRINRTGPTQFRLYFTLGDNNNAAANYMKFFSGNNPNNKPELIITYTMP